MYKLNGFARFQIFIFSAILCQAYNHNGATPYIFDTATERDPHNGKMPQETCLNAIGVPFVKHFANSRNCSTFWFCWEASPGVPVAAEYICPLYSSENGEIKLLSWNFHSCECDYPWNTTCYDELDTRHTLYRYNCAVPLSLSVVIS